jgi:thioesterase domain-containing protein
VDNLGVDDDFFELGGHSLLAVRLAAAAQLALGAEVPVSFLYDRGATVRGMAAAIEAAARGGDAGSTAGPGMPPSSFPNLFFVVPSETPLVALRHLQPVIGPEQAVVGLVSGHLGQEFDRSKSIEERAASMLQSVLAQQDRGPYFLAGFCFGGLIAYEMATQLHEDGQQVAWLGLVNTGDPSATTKRSNALTKVARALALGPRATTAAARRKARSPRAAGQEDLEARADVGGDEFDNAGASALSLGYTPRPNGIALDLFVSDYDAISHGRSLGWKRSHSDLLRVRTIRGNHRVLLDPGNATALARAMRESIDRVR